MPRGSKKKKVRDLDDLEWRYMNRDRELFQTHGSKGLKKAAEAHIDANLSKGQTMRATGNQFDPKYLDNLAKKYSGKPMGVGITRRDVALAKRIRGGTKPPVTQSTTPVKSIKKTGRGGRLRNKGGNTVGGEADFSGFDKELYETNRTVSSKKVCFKKKNGQVVSFTAKHSNSYCKK